MKQSWEKPQLIILARNKPEESVLWGCKGTTYAGIGSGAERATGGCYYIDTDPYYDCGQGCEWHGHT
jgi:hypothetical protein